MNFIGIDIGASFIKSAVLGLETKRVLSRRAVPFPKFLSQRKGEDTFKLVDASEVVAQVMEEIERLRNNETKGIVITGQMGGVILVREWGHQSPYISWQDQRCHRKMDVGLMPSGDRTYFETLVKLVGDDVFSLGELKPCTPIAHLHWLQNNWGKCPDATPTSLPDYVAWRLATCGGASRPITTDCTLAAAHGLYSITDGAWHEDLIERLGMGRLKFPTVVEQGKVIGHYRDIPIFTPVGDHQCSLLGTGLRRNELSINIGTGSQVSLIYDSRPTQVNVQWRPYFDGDFIRCITHIPAGRALNCLLRFVLELSNMSEDSAWAYVNEHVSGRRTTDLRWNLNFWPFKVGDDGASLQGILESNLDVPGVFLAAFNAMAERYFQAAGDIIPFESKIDQIRFSGGLARKIPKLRQVISERFGIQATISEDPDETLTCLLALALAWSGRDFSAQEAAYNLRRDA